MFGTEADTIGGGGGEAIEKDGLYGRRYGRWSERSFFSLVGRYYRPSHAMLLT